MSIDPLLRNFHPLRYCERCKQIKREDWMHSETECLGCRYDDSVESSKESKSKEKKIGKKHTGAALKGAAGLGEKEKAQPQGQVRLQLHLGF